MSSNHVRAALALTGLMILGACGGRLFGSSPVTETPTSVLTPPKHSAAKVMSLQVVRNFSDAKYLKIFDNLAQRPSGRYWGGTEFVIVGGGGNSTFPDNEFAAAFTPSANQTATVIEAAVINSGFSYGSTGFTLTVNQDDNGVPGKTLLTAQLPGLPYNGLGLCCAFVVGKIPSGLPLSGGKQYWLVLNGQGAQSNDAAGWAMNATDQLHPFLDAVYCAYASKCSNGPGWYAFQGTLEGTGAAFAVLGGK